MGRESAPAVSRGELRVCLTLARSECRRTFPSNERALPFNGELIEMLLTSRICLSGHG